MATKQVSLRVGQQTLDDPQFLKNGGTIISLEEQQALQAIQRGLQDLRLPGTP